MKARGAASVELVADRRGWRLPYASPGGAPDRRTDRKNLENGKVEQSAGLDRKDFMKALGVGLGAAGVTAMMGGPSFADVEKKKGKYVFVITHGADDPNRTIFALLMAQAVARRGWGSVHVWTTLHGAELAHKDKPERIESPIFKKFGNALSILKNLKGRGATFGCCPPCADYFGSRGDNRLDFFAEAGGDWLMENIQNAWVLWM